MNNYSTEIVLERPVAYGASVEMRVSTSVNQKYGILSASSCAASLQLRQSFDMTPTEMLLLADQLTAVALQIEARTTQRELPATILEAV